MKKANISKGFSLIEMLIVIAVIGIVGSIAAYSWQKYVANSGLRTAARELAGDIALYKQMAVGRNDTYTMTFDIANNNYTVTHANATDTVVKSLSVFGYGIALTSASFDFNKIAITVQPRGLTSSGTVTIANSRGSQAVLMVNSVGRIRLQFAMK